MPKHIQNWDGDFNSMRGLCLVGSGKHFRGNYTDCVKRNDRNVSWLVDGGRFSPTVSQVTVIFFFISIPFQTVSTVSVGTVGMPFALDKCEVLA